ncbi:hypothetical protein CLV47_1205 [Antricoccus suffuscus]|uniref:YgjP-like metallopeptidase domain-containing protein n=1 Tax=Antricoccus suffuscus TaxID=1629062 RepID=A0A2T0ZR05_9ACTN|nr:M48 family metallopeptidase [Antricoccus suffuscus]PRZ38538.1 hypothetical protein CLV47_1205 [Antricoccus suffuscus]
MAAADSTTYQFGTIDGVPVEVRRSRRRKRSVQAYRDGAKIVVLLPASMSRSEQTRWVHQMVDKVTSMERRRRSGVPASDEALLARSAMLSRRYLPPDTTPASVRWVTNQNSRWGSCTPSTKVIRLSHRLKSMPQWVVDYVLLHELTHLIVPGHGADFWAHLTGYAYTERAQGYLEGVQATAQLENVWELGEVADEHAG